MGDVYKKNGKVKPVMTIENGGSRCMAKVLVEREIKAFLELARNEKNVSSDSEGEETKADKPTDLYKLFENDEDEDDSACDRRTPPPVEFTASDHWQSELVTTTQRLAELYSLGHLSDLTITFSDSDEVIKAHKLMLASASFVFERMLYTDTKEARTGKVTLHCSVEGLKWILNNLYLGKSELGNVVTALRVYGVAQQYQMNGISAMCKDYLRYQISLDNVSEVFNAAKLFSEDSLMNACLTHRGSEMVVPFFQKLDVGSSKDDTCQSEQVDLSCSKLRHDQNYKLNACWPSVIKDHISEMTEELWMYLLQRPVLTTSEVMLFKGLVSWATYQLESDEEMATPVRIRQKLEKFLPHVRFLSIPLDSFIDNVVPTQVFTPEECTSILMRLRGISSSLPASFPCSPILYDRMELNQVDLRHVVLARISNDRRKLHPITVSDMVLVKNLTVSRPILVQQIQTQDNSTLKLAQMILTDPDGKQVGIAKPLGPTWRFVAPVFMHANKPYQITIDKVLVNKAYYKKDICSTSGDVKFTGCTGDNYIRLGFWPAHRKG